MNPIYCLFISLILVTPLADKRLNTTKTSPLTVYIFLHESCRISQYYTLILRELHQQYGSKDVQFKGIFPNQSTTAKDMQTFKEKYNLSFPMVFDKDQQLTQELGATITPEVIVVNSNTQAILYKGRIDNTYYRVGKRRQITTTYELKEVLEKAKNGKLLVYTTEQAIGCYIKKTRKFW